MILRSISTIAVVAFIVASPLWAQRMGSAFFVQISAGLAAHDNGAFSNRLMSYTPAAADGSSLLYQTQAFSGAGTVIGAEAGAMFVERYVASVVGEELMFPEMVSIGAPGSPHDSYRLSAKGGGLDLGYALVNDEGTLIYPFLHGGYYQYSLDYANNQHQAIPFFEGRPVAAHASATYTGAAPRWALGIGLKTFLGGVPGGGLLVGVRLTWGMMTSRPHWLEPDGSTVQNGGLTPGYNGVCLSLSIGGGYAGK